MLRFTSRSRTGNVRGLKLTPYLIRGMLRKPGGGGIGSFFKERTLRQIASGRKTRVEDTTRLLSKLFLTPSANQSFSRFLGDIFDEDYTRKEVRQARKTLRQMYGEEEDDDEGEGVGRKSRGRRGRRGSRENMQEFAGILKRIEQSALETQAVTLVNANKITRLSIRVLDLQDNVRSNAESAAQIASSTSRNVLESLTMLQQLVTQTSSSDVDSEDLFKRLYDLELGQEQILELLGSKRPTGRSATRANSNQVEMAKLDSEELVKIIEKNTIEDIRKILIEKRPDREDELNQILEAIAGRRSTLDIEEDELKEILKAALIEALKESDCCGNDSSMIGDILKTVLPIGRTLGAISRAIGGITRSIGSTLARYLPRLLAPAGLAVAGAAAVTAGIVTGIGGAEKRFVNKENEKIAPYGIQVVGKNDQNQFVYEDADGNRYTQDNMPQKYKDVLEGYAGDTRSRSSQEARKRVETNKDLYKPIDETKPQVQREAPPAAQIAPAPVLQEQTRVLAEQSPPVVQKQSMGNTQPIITNVYNNTVNNLPPKEKIKVTNSENTYNRLIYQDLDFPQTHGNLNMG